MADPTNPTETTDPYSPPPGDPDLPPLGEPEPNFPGDIPAPPPIDPNGPDDAPHMQGSINAGLDDAGPLDHQADVQQPQTQAE